MRGPAMVILQASGSVMDHIFARTDLAGSSAPPGERKGA